jgi:hypothetical protein
MAIYNKGLNKKPLVPGVSTANRLAGEVAKKQLISRPPDSNGLPEIDTSGRQSMVRPPPSGPLVPPTGGPPGSRPTDPTRPNQPGRDVVLPTVGQPYVSKTVTADFAGTPPVEIKDGKLVNKEAPPPQTEQELVDAAVRKLLEDQKINTEKERAAMQEEMKVAEARDIQSMRARTGLGGMGLTGAAGAMESQVRSEGARKQALTTAEFDRQARQEELSRIVAGIELKFGKDAADRARESYGIEKELATEELGVMRSMFPEGPEGDSQFNAAKKAAKAEEMVTKKQDRLNAVTADTAEDYVRTQGKGGANTITAAQYSRLPKGGFAVPGDDGYVYIITGHDPRRYVRIRETDIPGSASRQRPSKSGNPPPNVPTGTSNRHNPAGT